ncbi:unnamed protein product [Sympodiomycopsis kandeliae]
MPDKFSDAASIYSTTETLVDLPTLNNQATDYGSANSNDTDFSGDLSGVQLVLYNSYDSVPKEGDRLTRAGFPTTTSRGSATNGLFNTLKSLRKRLVTQVPLAELNRPYDHVADPQTAEDVQRAIDGKPSGRGLATLFQWQLPDLIALRRRTRLSLVLAVLYKTPEVRDPFACYPSHRVVHSPQVYIDKKTGHSKVPVRWATISALAPDRAVPGADIISEQDKGKGKSKEDYAEVEAFYEANPKLKATYRETGQDIFERVQNFSPVSQETQNELTGLLEHLESRGVIWTDAAVDVRPTIIRQDPYTRNKFLVLGLFPVSFLDRCSWFYKNGRRPQESDLEHPKGLPLLIRKGNDVPSEDEPKKAINTDSSDSSLGEDFLQNWTVSVTREPYVDGRTMSASVAAFAGAGMAGGFGGGC